MSNAKLRIDIKRYRMCIHRNALKEIGDPPFLHFCYNPEKKRLMVIGTWLEDGRSVRVRYDSHGSVYIHSKPLLTGIREVSNIMSESGSYLAEGEVRQKENQIIFSLADAKYFP